MKKTQFLCFLFLILAACKNEGNKDRNYRKEKHENKPFHNKNKSVTSSKSMVRESVPLDENQQNRIEILDADLLLFNGKVKRFFSLKDFKKNFGEADSIKLMNHEDRCPYVFQNIAPAANLQDKFLYKDGSRFENSNEKVAIDEFKFTKNNYVVYKGITLNASTTINKLQEMFPNAVENITPIKVYGESEVQMIQLKEGNYELYDGHINIFLKNKKLLFIQWWLPC